MRRTTWLAAGAVLGVMGYRRLDRAAKTFTGGAEAGGTTTPTVSPGLASTAKLAKLTAGAAGWLIRRTPSFVMDVRAGMAEYLDQHQADSRRANLNRQHPRSGNTLVGQRAPDRASIPAANKTEKD